MTLLKRPKRRQLTSSRTRLLIVLFHRFLRVLATIGRRDLEDMLSGLSSDCEQLCIVLPNIQGLFCRLALLTPDYELDVLLLGECCLRDGQILKELHRRLKSERAETKAKLTQVRQLEEQGRVTSKDLEVLPAPRARVDELTGWVCIVDGLDGAGEARAWHLDHTYSWAGVCCNDTRRRVWRFGEGYAVVQRSCWSGRWLGSFSGSLDSREAG